MFFNNLKLRQKKLRVILVNLVNTYFFVKNNINAIVYNDVKYYKNIIAYVKFNCSLRKYVIKIILKFILIYFIGL